MTAPTPTPHRITLIKQAVVNILLGRTLAAVTELNPNGDPDVYPIPYADKRIFPNRSTPLWPQEIEEKISICVFFLSETVDNSRSGNGKHLDRMPKIRIEAATAAVRGFDDMLHAAAVVIEALLLKHRTIIDPLDVDKTILCYLNIDKYGFKSSDMGIATEAVAKPTGVLAMDWEGKWVYDVPPGPTGVPLQTTGLKIKDESLGLSAEIDGTVTTNAAPP